MTPDPTWKLAAEAYRAGRDYALTVASVPMPWTYNATVRVVHDGDTLTADISAGPLASATLEVPIRTLGINAAELKTPGGDAAAAYVQQLLPPGTPIVLTTASPDKYAPRVDAAISFVMNGAVTDLGAWLVTQGWAAAWDGKGTKPVPPWPRPVA